MGDTTISTRLAQVERIEPDVVLVRYNENAAFDVAGIAEVIAACEKLPLTEFFAAVNILPAEGGMNMQAMQHEHSTAEGARRTKASAIVVTGELLRRLTEIHFNYYPQHFEVRIFSNVQDAHKWVRAILDKLPPP